MFPDLWGRCALIIRLADKQACLFMGLFLGESPYGSLRRKRGGCSKVRSPLPPLWADDIVKVLVFLPGLVLH